VVAEVKVRNKSLSSSAKQVADSSDAKQVAELECEAGRLARMRSRSLRAELEDRMTMILCDADGLNRNLCCKADTMLLLEQLALLQWSLPV
jgi:hypothetical protein